MSHTDPSWDDIFSSQPGAPAGETPDTVPATPSAVPQTRREARAAAAAAAGTGRPEASTGAEASGGTAASGDTAASEGTVPPARPPRAPRRRRRWLPWVISLVVVLGLGAGSVAYVWLNYEDQVRKVLGWELPPEDYVGTGTGETTVIISPGDTGDVVAKSLVEAGVIKSYDVFYALLLKENPQFYPGYYILAEQMSARAALDALLDPASRVENTALIHEGRSINDAFEILSAATGLTVEELQAAAADPTAYGAPAEAPSLEGYLFPAKYTFDPGIDAHTVLQTLVNRTFQALDAAGVAPADRHRVLTMAALIQREAGPIKEDFYKVSRVFANRLAKPMNLESDATVSYGTGRTDTVWTTPAERADASNIYNTYANPGLPAGPIGAAGDLAIDAALHPAEGPWFYFVPVNLETGETVFSVTYAEHQKAAQQLYDWCRTTQSPNCD